MSVISARITEVIDDGGPDRAIWDSGRWWTWAEVSAARAALQQHMRAARAERGPAGVAMRTSFGPVVAELSLIAAGLTIHSLNPSSGDERLRADVVAAALPVVIAEPVDWERPGLRQGCEEAGSVGLAILPGPPWIETIIGGGTATQAPLADDEIPTASDGMAVRMLTSGTTGPPKRIPISYAELDNMMAAVSHYSRGPAGDGKPPAPALIAAPLVHSSGFGGVLRAAFQGRPLVLLEKFAPGRWAELIREHKIRFVGLPPTALRMLFDADIDPNLLASLRAIGVGTAPMDPDFADRFEARFQIPLLPAYGATEFPGGLAGWSMDDKKKFGPAKRGSVGRVHAGVSLKVLDPDNPDREVPVGVVGVLAARTPTTPGADWVRTNDLASIDEDGFVFLHGRADDAIIRGGFKITPSDVEKVLESHPAVRFAAVIGLPDERLGAVPVAAIEVEQQVETTELLDWLRTRLVRYQVPVRLVVVDELPRTPALKISKPGVKEIFTRGA